MLCQPRDLLYTSCRAVWEDGSHISACVHAKKKKKKLYQARHKSQPPTYQTRDIHHRHLLEKPNPQPLSLPSVHQLPLLSLTAATTTTTTPFLCLSSPSCLGWGLMSWEPEEDQRGKDGMLRPPWGHWTDTAVLERRDISLAQWQPRSAWASGMISCSRGAAKNCNACVRKTV